MFNVPAFVNTAVAVPKSSIAPVDTTPLTDQLLACAWSCRDVEGTVDTSVVRCSATIAHGGGGSRVAPRCAVFTDALYYTRRLSAAGGAAGICCRGTANNVCVCVKRLRWHTNKGGTHRRARSQQAQASSSPCLVWCSRALLKAPFAGHTVAAMAFSFSGCHSSFYASSNYNNQRQQLHLAQAVSSKPSLHAATADAQGDAIARARTLQDWATAATDPCCGLVVLWMIML